MIFLKVVSISWSKLIPYLRTSGCIFISSGHSFVIKASNTHFKEEILDKLWTNLYGIWYLQCVVWDYLGLWKKVERNSSLKRCMSPLVKAAKKILRSKVMLFSKNMYASETMKSLPSWQLPWLDVIFEGSCHQRLESRIHQVKPVYSMQDRIIFPPFQLFFCFCCYMSEMSPSILEQNALFFEISGD